MRLLFSAFLILSAFAPMPLVSVAEGRKTSSAAAKAKAKPDQPPPPHVVLIVCDDLNDSVETLGGHPQAITPNLDRFASTGVRFQRAYSNAPICAPSRASFLTGIYPSTSGNYRFDKWFEIPVLMNSKTLMAHFRDNGYRVAGTGKLMHLHRRGEYQEFGESADYGPFAFDGEKQVGHPSVPEVFHEMGALDGSFAPLSDVPFDGKDGAGWVTGNWKKPNQPFRYGSSDDRDRTPDEKNATWAADYIRAFPESRHAKKPFFLAVGFIRPHTPMVAPKRFFDLFPIDGVEPAKFLEGDLDDTHFAGTESGERGFRTFELLEEGYGSAEAGLKAYTQAYLACVAAVDECVGEVIDALDESGQAENTIVVVTSDHGFNLGEKAYVYKNSLWEESARIPLVIRAPGIAPAGADASQPVSLIDLYPTLVDLCGLEGDTRKNEQGRPLDGHSLRPFLEDPEHGTWDGPDGALTVVGGGWSPGDTHHYSLRTAQWRYILYNNGKEELYDHDDDPNEWTNLADSPEQAAIKQTLHEQLVALRGEPAPNATPVKPAAKPWDWFGAMDQNKDEKVAEAEWLAWAKETDERKNVPFDETKRRNAFRYFDADGNGELSRQELADGETESAEPAEPAAQKTEPSSDEAWKDQFFERHPDADADKDGVLSWPEYKAYKAKLDAEQKKGVWTAPPSPSLAWSSPVPVNELFEPRVTLSMRVKSSGAGKVTRKDGQWHLTGPSPLRVEFAPAEHEAWDLSTFRLLGVPVRHREPGVTTIVGRLNNSGVTGWSRHAAGFAVAPSGDDATLGFPFPVAEDRYPGPAVFGDQLAKPNGHRVHWRQFFPEDVRVLKLIVESSSGTVDLFLNDPFLAWPASPGLDAVLHEMPFLDELGQVRAVTWPGKAANIDEARAQRNREQTTAAEQAKASTFSRFGGWAEGPQLEATGHFRTEKVDGRWWLVDPEGYLFFSVGACLAGIPSETVINQKRLDAGFFAYLPGEDDYLRWAGRRQVGKREWVRFPVINAQRMAGEGWNQWERRGIHDRLRAWGVNTLGAWSDEAMQQDGRTPYTLIASIWWQPNGHKKFPSPFREDYEEDLRETLRKFAWAKDDPFCLGIFLGNELHWPDRFTPVVFDLPESDATKSWVRDRLKTKYPALEDLNACWKTAFTAWEEVLRRKPNPIPEAAWSDIEPLYLEFTTTFFKRTKKAIADVLPHKLYLGCRTHAGPNVLGRGALGHVDVFSVNVYDSRVASWQVPDDVDIPILAGEFHFGAVDRGVPSPGLSGAWDQRQRGLSFAHYLASALADPRFVGVHWFQWMDQSAAGRNDRENHQCGFLDVTGRAYPEFTQTVTRATQAMYPARAFGETSRVKVLEALIGQPIK